MKFVSTKRTPLRPLMVFALYIPQVPHARKMSSGEHRHCSVTFEIQSNLSNTDTEGTERNVRIGEVSVYKKSL